MRRWALVLWVAACLLGVSCSGSGPAAVDGVSLRSLAVTPLDPNFLSSCRSRQVVATATYSDGSAKDVTEQAAWSSTDPAVATVSDQAGSKGRLETAGPGTTQVRADLDGVVASSTITVTSDPVARYPGRVLSVGSLPQAVALGDVNGDGRLDLATADSNSDRVSVLLGKGDGTFQASQGFGTGSQPFSLALGDLDGDGCPDLATASNSSGNASVLLNHPATP